MKRLPETDYVKFTRFTLFSLKCVNYSNLFTTIYRNQGGGAA